MRLKKPMSVVMLDVDYFKKYNDSYGHQDGDDCLKLVAQELAHSAPRAGDLVARYGGEEFVMILGDTDEDGAHLVADRICQHVAGLKLPHKDSPYGHVTVSCGVSSVVPGHDLSPDTLVKSADNALYLAKNEGRNSVACLNYGQI